MFKPICQSQDHLAMKTAKMQKKRSENRIPVANGILAFVECLEIHNAAWFEFDIICEKFFALLRIFFTHNDSKAIPVFSLNMVFLSYYWPI